MADSDSDNEEKTSISNPDVVTKYKAAAEICNKAIAAVIEACQEGAKIVDVCSIGDTLINKEVASIFNAKKKGGAKVEKGIAFPTSASINNVVGHYSPAADDIAVLKAGDVVKIDLGVHVDGYVAVQAQTLVVGSAPATGKAADVIAAARTAFDAALRLIRPGKHVSDVTGPLSAIVEAFGCTLVEGVMSHEMKQFVIDGNKCVLNRPAPDAKVEDNEFEENEVYAIDIVVSTGEGKPRVMDEKQTQVYKRSLDASYNLKLKASRAVFSIIQNSFPAMPFTLRALAGEGEKDAKDPLGAAQLSMGLKECLNHGLLHAYPVLYEKTGEIVAHIKGTVLLTANGSDLVTKAPVQPVESAKKVEDPELLALLAEPIRKQKKKNKVKAAA
mmetsp:Transcript_17381/g.29787  ORF Transcript_17381/g.29787 Transcript_17381/m.29787 type:complete len:386 (+) Transcript_17381:39-1196(+)|eukprot:CAMPEP_0119106340 /NCGR_PEP_ID=MMETSP1180-20130426/4055_1 /TAXON_ID=3052 ORGANISM="Chlamydomonas cf sp, Strain CCMP681" /NCGR_SAMPLE_ID=MMETSP1180 /ASSEMBLY_ACC=CAM_ASM_000741 /LENGTH=385 /DNA_ID=CAMNT_0007091657 /DNA_START=41 /DNA_END=1198 /DNA_ORIENTATION=+